MDDALPMVEGVVAQAPGVAAAYVFGSVARGESRPESDVDVGVLYTEQPPATLQGVVGDLRRVLQRALGREVDLVVLNDAPPDLVHRVLRDGVLVCDRDRPTRLAFEVKSRNAYWDVLPFLERYRRAAS